MLSLTLRVAAATFAFILSCPVSAYLVEPAVTTRVVDVGHGSCSVVLVDKKKEGLSPDDRFYVMVYGAGGEPGRCSKGLALTLPKGVKAIDLLLLSDAEDENTSEAISILDKYSVSSSWVTLPKKPTKSQHSLKKALDKEILAGGSFRNLSKLPVSEMESIDVGGVAKIEFFGLGFDADAVAAKISVGDESVLLTQSLNGREKLAPDNRCGFEERDMVRKYGGELKSTVMLAPNHGSNSSSSKCFIEAVAPEYVIFQSGHKRQLPARAVANRYMAFGVDADNIYRTDKGDNEALVGGHTFEWAGENGCRDGAGDDDVLVHLYDEAEALIGYFNDGYYESCL